jgi:hypothetical protein
MMKSAPKTMDHSKLVISAYTDHKYKTYGIDQCFIIYKKASGFAG